MRYRELGTTGIKVSEVGLGCWTMGGPNFSPVNGQPIGWKHVDENDILDAIKVALDGGVNHWDNADVYGNGHAERLLGRCLRSLGVKPASQVIATKVGHLRGSAPHGFDPHHIRRQCEQSLRNLGADTIDLYYFHHGTFVGPDRDGKDHDYLHEAASTMHKLRKEGKVRAIGQSAYSVEDFERALPVVKPDVLQNKANLRYDEFVRPASRMQQLMREHKCSFVAFGPLDQGILLDKFDPDNPPKFDGEYRANRKDFTPETLREVRARLQEVKRRFDPTGSREPVALLSSIAQRWILSHDHVCSTTPGFRNASQVRANLAAATDAPMEQEDAAWLRATFHGAPQAVPR
jgi:aryl-alcohol dehydrogenase-like predicted oxidoreductase